MSDDVRSTYDEFKRKHPDLLAAAEAEMEVTEEIERLREIERFATELSKRWITRGLGNPIPGEERPDSDVINDLVRACGVSDG